MAKKKPVVSKYGQWKYPGQETIIPNANGNITMQGVPYPVLGIDDLGNQQLMLPGMDYQFPGNSVYEIPMAKMGGAKKVKIHSLPQAQKGQNVLYVDSKKDPAYKAYSDSLNLHRATIMQDKLMGPGSKRTNDKIDWTTKELKEGRKQVIKPGLEHYGPISSDFQNEADQFKDGYDGFSARPQDKKLIDYYKSLGFTDNNIMYHSSPDVVSDKIKPIYTYSDGTAYSPYYKKPSRQVIVQKTPELKMKEAGLLPNPLPIDIRPQLQSLRSSGSPVKSDNLFRTPMHTANNGVVIRVHDKDQRFVGWEDEDGNPINIDNPTGSPTSDFDPIYKPKIIKAPEFNQGGPLPKAQNGYGGRGPASFQDSLDVANSAQQVIDWYNSQGYYGGSNVGDKEPARSREGVRMIGMDKIKKVADKSTTPTTLHVGGRQTIIGSDDLGQGGLAIDLPKFDVEIPSLSLGEAGAMALAGTLNAIGGIQNLTNESLAEWESPYRFRQYADNHKRVINTDAPKALYDIRIDPRSTFKLQGTAPGYFSGNTDIVDMPMYEKFYTAPWSILSEADKRKRLEFGILDGTPFKDWNDPRLISIYPDIAMAHGGRRQYDDQTIKNAAASGYAATQEGAAQYERNRWGKNPRVYDAQTIANAAKSGYPATQSGAAEYELNGWQKKPRTSKSSNSTQVKKEPNANTDIGYYMRTELGLDRKQTSYEERKKLAERYGIENYSGTSKQNMELLNRIKSESNPKQSVLDVLSGKKSDVDSKTITSDDAGTPVNSTPVVAPTPPKPQKPKDGYYRTPIGTANNGVVIRVHDKNQRFIGWEDQDGNPIQIENPTGSPTSDFDPIYKPKGNTTPPGFAYGGELDPEKPWKHKYKSQDGNYAYRSVGTNGMQDYANSSVRRTLKGFISGAPKPTETPTRKAEAKFQTGGGSGQEAYWKNIPIDWDKYMNLKPFEKDQLPIEVQDAYFRDAKLNEKRLDYVVNHMDDPDFDFRKAPSADDVDAQFGPSPDIHYSYDGKVPYAGRFNPYHTFGEVSFIGEFPEVRIPAGKKYSQNYIDWDNYDPQLRADYFNTRNEVTNFYKNWYSKRATLPQFTDVANRRLAGLKDVEFQPYGSQEEYDEDNPGTAGVYKHGPMVKGPVGNAIYIPPSGFKNPSLMTHEESHYLDYNYPQNPAGLLSPSYNEEDAILDNIIPQEYKQPSSEGDDSVYKSSSIYLPFANKEELFAANPISALFGSGQPMTDYYYNPTEIRARLNEWRKYHNIDPTKDYTDEEIQTIIDDDINRNDGLNFDLYKLIRGRGDLLKKIHDSQVSTGNKENPDAVPQAKKGGQPKFQSGGDISVPDLRRVKIHNLPKAQKGVPVTNNMGVPYGRTDVGYVMPPIYVHGDPEKDKVLRDVITNPSTNQAFRQIDGNSNLPVRVVDYPYGYPGMPPGHMEAAVWDKEANDFVNTIGGAQTRINRWPSGNLRVYDGYEDSSKVRTADLNLSGYRLANFLKNANTPQDYNFVFDNCADGVCRGLDIDPDAVDTAGITDPAKTMDYIIESGQYNPANVQGRRVDMPEGVRTIFDKAVYDPYVKPYVDAAWNKGKQMVDDSWNYLFKKKGGELRKAQKGEGVPYAYYNPQLNKWQDAPKDPNQFIPWDQYMPVTELKGFEFVGKRMTDAEDKDYQRRINTAQLLGSEFQKQNPSNAPVASDEEIKAFDKKVNAKYWEDDLKAREEERKRLMQEFVDQQNSSKSPLQKSFGDLSLENPATRAAARNYADYKLGLSNPKNMLDRMFTGSNEVGLRDFYRPHDASMTLTVPAVAAAAAAAPVVAEGAALGLAGADAAAMALYEARLASPFFRALGAGMAASPSMLPGLSLNNTINAAFAAHGLKTIVSGEAIEPWREAIKTGNVSDYLSAAGQNLMTGLEILPVAAPLIKGGYQLAKPAINAAGEFITTQTPIRNTYKINPWAGKLGEYNRVVGSDAIADLQASGLVRSGEGAVTTAGGIPVSRPTAWPSFAKGSPRETYMKGVMERGDTPYIISTDRPMAVSTLGRHGKGSTQFPVGPDGNYLTSFPASEATVYKGSPNWLKGYETVNTPKKLEISMPEMPVIGAPAQSGLWTLENLPGLHLESTVTGGPVSKIIEPKTGLINTEQALKIIGKEAGGKEKLELVRNAIGENIPAKMDYNQFRKLVQDAIIPLEKRTVNYNSNYGLGHIGYPSPKRSNIELALNNSEQEVARLTGELDNLTTQISDIKAFRESVAADPSKAFLANGTDEQIKTYLEGIEKYTKEQLASATKQAENNRTMLSQAPLTNETLLLSNKEQLGRGAPVHGNPDETLGHIHYYVDAENPSTAVMTQMQSDAFQGTHRVMPSTLQDATNKMIAAQEDLDWTNALYTGTDKGSLAVIKKANEQFAFDNATVKNYVQKSLLDKKHQERYLQEFVQHSAEKGMSKVRIPTSETAAKIQGYNPMEFDTSTAAAKEARRRVMDAHRAYGPESQEFKDANDAYDALVKSAKPEYIPEQKTILKKYDQMPKTVKKTFGEEVQIVTDSKGNTWYEFSIPENFIQGKGEIKAFKNGGQLPKAQNGLGVDILTGKAARDTQARSWGQQVMQGIPGYPVAPPKAKSKPTTSSSSLKADLKKMNQDLISGSAVAESTMPANMFKPPLEWEGLSGPQIIAMMKEKAAYDALPEAVKRHDVLTADTRSDEEKFARQAWTALSHPIETISAVSRGYDIPSGYMGMGNPYEGYGVGNPVTSTLDMVAGAPGFVANAIYRQGEKAVDNPGEYLLTNTLGLFDPEYRNEALGNYLDLSAAIPASRAMATPLVKSATKAYNKVATGNSFIDRAWKVERPNFPIKSTDYIARPNTDVEIGLLNKFGKGMKTLTPEEWAGMENLTRSGATDFSKGDYPISRILGYYDRGSAENKLLEGLKVGDVFHTPTEKTIRTWSVGTPGKGNLSEYGNTRLVIPSKYTKGLGNNFGAMPYNDKRLPFIWNPETGRINSMAVAEKEIMGNIPKGFKVIGTSKEDGLRNLIIKPLKKKGGAVKRVKINALPNNWKTK
jgi:hypothetical protein